VNTLSVLIATKNRPQALQTCVQSILAQEPKPLEIVIIDQSPTGGPPIANGQGTSFVSVRHISKPNLSGLTQARNLAVSLASGTVLLFLDDDVELAPGYVREILGFFDGDQSGRLGGIGGHIINLPETVSWLQRVRLRLFYRGPFSVERDALAFHLHPGDHPRRARRLNGCNMAYRREVFDRATFDEGYSGYGLGEDRDFSVQVSRAYELWWVPGARVSHKQTPASRLDRERFCELRILSWLRFYEKCTRKSPGALLSYVWLNMDFLALGFKVWDWATVRGTWRGLCRLAAIASGRADLNEVLRDGWHPESS